MLDFLIGVGVTASFFAILSISLNLQAGVTGLLDFGLIAFFGIGAYSTGIASLHGVHWAIGMAIGVVLASVAGAAVGRLGRTLRTEYWAIATLALAELLRLIATNAESWTKGSQGITSIPLFFGGSELAWLGIAVALLIFCAVIAHVVTETQFGRILRLIREREDLAASLGHDVIGAKQRAMALSAPMAAIVGSLYTHYLTYIGPQQLAPFATFLVFTMVIVGGLGNHVGVIVGAFLVQLLYDVTRFINDVITMPAETAGGIRVMVIGLALLGFLSFRSQGLVPERSRTFGVKS